MKLTIVTTTYNQEKFIGQAIDGMLMQKTNFPYKILISNDCSTDETGQILENYKNEYPDKIEIINHKENLGAMENFIDTLSRVKDTEYVALCDGDDFWTDENKLQEQIDFLDNNKEFSICCHQTKMFYEKKEKDESILPINIKEITSLKDLVDSNYIVANSVIYRWVFNEVNLKDVFPRDIVPGDYYVHLLHAQHGKIKLINKVMSAYRRHDKGMWWSNDDINKEEFSFEYGRKFLNFYNAADLHIKLPKNAFLAQRKSIIYDMIVAYIKKGMFNELYKEMISQKDKELFNENLKDILNRNTWYLEYLISKEKGADEFIKIKQELESIKNSRWWKLRKILLRRN